MRAAAALPGSRDRGDAAAATWTFRGCVAAAAATRTFRGDESRRRRGRHADIPRRRIATWKFGRGERRRLRRCVGALEWARTGDNAKSRAAPQPGDYQMDLVKAAVVKHLPALDAAEGPRPAQGI